jgi:peptidoglycan/xylan/chitin deacetylase (PgdA/CDA1 family)
MFRASVSSLLKKGVASAGLLPWWERCITPWPRVILYHYVGTESPPFLREMALTKDRFLEQLSVLRQRYRFLTWKEYKEALASSRKAERSILLTFDDGFRSSWNMGEELATGHKIPTVFFVNTRVLDNAYAPWMIQYYFLRSQSDGRFLEPLWKSISGSVPLSPDAARSRCHERFSLRNVVEPIEEGLAKFGMTPAELAQRYQLYMASANLLKRSDLIEIGNHSHSHYILSKLNDFEFDEDLRSSHEILNRLLRAGPECFAYPFGVPGVHFDERCLRRLRAISSYPYIFSAADRELREVSRLDERGRICLDNAPPKEVVGTVAKVTPRALQHWLVHRSLPASEN